MRKVTFYIDDLAYFKHTAPGVDLGNEESFKAIYTLYGEGKNIERYELTDHEGNKISLPDLNGYQKGVILNDCKAHFEGSSYHGGGTWPCGVIKIEDQNRNNSWKERVCVDIENAMRCSNSFEEYKAALESKGYSLHKGNSERFGDYISYTTPDGKKVRDYTLGPAYTQEELKLSFKLGQNKPSLNEMIADAANRTAPPSGNGGPYIKQLERLPVYDEPVSR